MTRRTARFLRSLGPSGPDASALQIMAWVNVGRSNDENNWEILCNPGGGQQLIITTRDSCTDYHEEWAFNQG